MRTTRYRETIYVADADADAGQISGMYRLCGPGVLGRAPMEAFPFKGQV